MNKNTHLLINISSVKILGSFFRYAYHKILGNKYVQKTNFEKKKVRIQGLAILPINYAYKLHYYTIYL